MFPPKLTFLISLCVISLTAEVARCQEPTADAPSLRTLIDRQIEASFTRSKAKPAERSSDAEFLRRIYLHLIGTIPDATATRKFLEDCDSNKRSKLIDQLLASPRFAENMAVVFDVMLMERRPDKHIKTDEWRDYLKNSIAQNKPLNVLVAEILKADGVDADLRPAAKFFLDRAVDKDVLVRDIGRMFLGVDWQCCQCHDHPNIDGYLHEHYYGLSVFVAGSKTFRQKDGTTVLQEMIEREVEFASVFEPDKSRKTGPRIIGNVFEVPEFKEGEEYAEKPSRTVRAVPKFSLRGLLAEKLPNASTPEFARNMANRLWAMMMGRGLVYPLDMNHAANPPSHPELLNLLATHLTNTKYDMKGFLRELASSETYQRSSMIPEDVDPLTVPPESFAVANLKGLSPEQLFHSLIQATDSEKLLEVQIETTLKEDEAAYQELIADEAKLKAARKEKRAEILKEFVTLFGGVPGQPTGEFQSSLTQALFLANSDTAISWIRPGSGNLTDRLTKLEENSQVIDDVYYSVLSRSPTPEEAKVASEHFAKQIDNRQAALMEFVWSLIASAEFRFNH